VVETQGFGGGLLLVRGCCGGGSEAEDGREDDLGVFSGLEGQPMDGLGELEEEVFLDDGGDELVALFGAALGLWERGTLVSCLGSLQERGHVRGGIPTVGAL
jgi:hypothetical protein